MRELIALGRSSGANLEDFARPRELVSPQIAYSNSKQYF